MAHTLVMAAVRVVLPWSTWPMVPTLTCGFFRSNFSLDMAYLAGLAVQFRGETELGAAGSVAPALGGELVADVGRNRCVVVELHAVDRAALGGAAQAGAVAEHLGQRDVGGDDLRSVARLHTINFSAARG